MGKIKVLKDVVANRIAAGEVVERPESIVKELIENSIDSGADKIDVFIKNGGKTGIVVSDNGCGMSYDDAIIAFERHATSKIKTEKDLESIKSLGFRGEALPSIASVTKLLLKTKIKEEDEGTIVKIEGGIIKNVSTAPLNSGTYIEISSLFYNIPARKKFLKSVETEYSRIVRVIHSYALANPKIAFTLNHNGRIVVKYSKRQTLKDRISSLLDKNYSNAEIQYENICIKAFLLPPESAIKSQTKQFFLLNGRFVKERTISSALLSAYKSVTSFFSGYPQAVIWMQVPHNFVDVNVHPAKLEVRFKNQGVIYNLVKDVCTKALRQRKETPKVFLDSNKNSLSLTEKNNEQTLLKKNTYQPAYSSQFPDIEGNDNERIRNTNNNEFKNHIEKTEQQEQTEFKVIGQFQNSYILVEKIGELYIVDQHVAHERILYEQTLKRLANGTIEKTNLLIPEVVNVGDEVLPLIIQKKDIFFKTGFRFDAIDTKTVKITTVPVFLKQKDITKTFLDVVSVIVDYKDKETEEIYKDLAATVGCKAAIKANTNLPYPQMQELLNNIMKTDNPYYCPHGRPIIIKLSLEQIEKMFKRK
jgi:DNA mismatch repair protein MutL